MFFLGLGWPKMNPVTIDQIVNNADIYLTMKDRNNKYRYCNEKFSELLNIDSPRSIHGKTDFDFFPEKLASIYRQGDVYTASGNYFKNREECIIDYKAKKKVPILVSKNIYRDKSGAAKGVVVSFVIREQAKMLDCSDKPQIKLSYNKLLSRYYFPFSQAEYFTEREYQVFLSLFKGIFSAKQIAGLLDISHRTVEAYILSIQRKLQCQSKYEIIPQAMLLGLLSG